MKSRAFLKIARIFVQQAGQHGVAEKIAGEVVRVGGAESLCVAFHALSVFSETVVGLVDTGNKSSKEKGHGSVALLKKSWYFWPGSQGKRILVVGGVEGRHYAQNPLVLLLLELHLRLFPLFFFRVALWAGEVWALMPPARWKQLFWEVACCGFGDGASGGFRAVSAGCDRAKGTVRNRPCYR